MKFQYTAMDFELGEDWAWVKLKEWVEYFYVDSEMPTGEVTTYEIDMVKAGDKWYAADLTSDFWFDSCYDENTFTTDDLRETLQTLETGLKKLYA